MTLHVDMKTSFALAELSISLISPSTRSLHNTSLVALGIVRMPTAEGQPSVLHIECTSEALKKLARQMSSPKLTSYNNRIIVQAMPCKSESDLDA